MEPALVLRRVFRVSKKRLFEAWTNPVEIKKWWQLGEGWTVTSANVNLRVGGKFHIAAKSDQGAYHAVTGTFREIVPEERLVYTWVVEDAKAGPEESLVIVEFREQDGNTELTLNHEFLRKRARLPVEGGWVQVLQGLRNFLG